MRVNAILRMASLAVVFHCAWASVTGAAEPTPAELLQRKLAEADRLQAEIDQLREATRTPQTIYVNVEMLEVNLTKVRELGMDFQKITPDGVNAASVAEVFATGGMLEFGDGKQGATDFVAALKRNNIAKTLANPCVAVMSGKPASVVAGGQFPVPAAPGAAAAVEFQEFGTRLDVLAKALGNNRVRLHLHPRISDVVDARTIEVHGRRVPSLDVQECDTYCETTFGETVVLSGLVTQRHEAIKRGGGPMEERIQEIALCVVVRAEDASKLGLKEAAVDGERVSAAPYDAPK